MIELMNLSFGYDQKHPLLRDLSMRFDNRHMNFITGQTGAGKSTLLKILGLYLPPHAGHLYYGGRDMANLSGDERALMRQRIGYVFQDFKLFDQLNVIENILLPVELAGQDPQEFEASADELLDWVGLSEQKYAPVDYLSGGEKQRVAIARALINRPEILLADEPTGNLDPMMAERIMFLLRELQRLDTLVIIATHQHSLYNEKTDRLFNLQSSTLIEQKAA